MEDPEKYTKELLKKTTIKTIAFFVIKDAIICLIGGLALASVMIFIQNKFDIEPVFIEVTLCIIAFLVLIYGIYITGKHAKDFYDDDWD